MLPGYIAWIKALMIAWRNLTRVCVVGIEYKMIHTALQTRDDLFPLIHYAPVQFRE